MLQSDRPKAARPGVRDPSQARRGAGVSERSSVPQEDQRLPAPADPARPAPADPARPAPADPARPAPADPARPAFADPGRTWPTTAPEEPSRPDVDGAVAHGAASSARVLNPSPGTRPRDSDSPGLKSISSSGLGSSSLRHALRRLFRPTSPLRPASILRGLATPARWSRRRREADQPSLLRRAGRSMRSHAALATAGSAAAAAPRGPAL
jgi:hypothetical protein